MTTLTRRFLPLFFLLLTACAAPTPAQGKVLVTLDMGSGGAGFAATIYVQEVATGKTFSSPYSAGSHGLVVLPTSAPVAINVDAPGSYIVYARLVNDPDSYHYGATACGPAQDCPDSSLLAFDVQPGETIPVTIADRAALLPGRGEPVTVPWRPAGK